MEKYIFNVKLEDVDKAVEMYKENIPFTVIAKKLGVSRSTISCILRQKGIYRADLGRIRSLKELCGIKVKTKAHGGYDVYEEDCDTLIAANVKLLCARRGIDFDDIARDYRNKMPVAHIAKKYGMHHNTIRNYLVMAGVFDSMTSIERAVSVIKKHDISEKLENKIIQLYREGLTYKEIMYEVGINTTVLRNVIRKNKLSRKSSLHSDELEHEIVGLYLKGVTIDEIKDKVSVSRRKTAEILHKHGISLKGNLIGKDKEDLIVKLYNDGIKCMDIAVAAGVSYGTISNVVRRSGIRKRKRRNHSKA